MKRIMNKKAITALLTAAVIGSSLSSAAWAADSTFAISLMNVTTVAGNGGHNSMNGAAQSANFRMPQGLALQKDGSLLVADSSNHLIRQLKGGQVTTFAGLTFDADGKGLPVGGLVDGSSAQSFFQSPVEIELDSSGNIFVADADNNAIRKIDARGNVNVYAGDADGVSGSADGQGTSAKFYHPSDIAIATDGTVYVSDTLNHTIRQISSNGAVTTLNGTSERYVEVTPGQVVLAGDYKDGKLSEALFNEPTGLVLDAKGNLIVSDSGNQLIRYIDLAAGTVTTLAGGKDVKYEANALYAAGDYIDGAAVSAKFDFPKGLALTAEGGIVIADSSNNAIRYLYNGTVSTIVGTLDAQSGSEDGASQKARLQNPTDVVVAPNGDIYVADSYNNKIRKISSYSLPSDLKKDGTIKVVIDNKIIAFDAQPQNVNSRVMVPVRAIAEQLGYKVESSDNVKVVLSQGDTVYEFSIGNATVKKSVGGIVTTSKVDALPYIANDRTYVPVRFISEQLDKQVDWNSEYQTVIIR